MSRGPTFNRAKRADVKPTGPRRASTAPKVMAVLSPILKANAGVTIEMWVTVDRGKATATVRQQVVLALRGQGWSVSAVARAVGVDPQTVRRYDKIAHGIDPRRRAAPPADRVALPVVADGPTMVARPGPRHECVYDSACLDALLRQYPRANPPSHASCPPACPWRLAPDRDEERYLATRKR
jgi:hypothetical protein